MTLYSRHILPKLLSITCDLEPIRRQREKVVPRAHGRVLEVGFGSGLNLRFYDPAKVSKVWGLDPAPEMTRMAERTIKQVPFSVGIIGLPGDRIPLADGSVDTVLMTYTLCTIPDTIPALRQIGRVLHPAGQLIFCEHGAAPDSGVRRWQDFLDPGWRLLFGGCHLNRAIPALIEEGGFHIKDLETMHIPGWRPASFNYWGTAVPR